MRVRDLSASASYLKPPPLQGAVFFLLRWPRACKLALFQRAQILEMNENQAMCNKPKHNPQSKSTLKSLTIFATPNFTRPDEALHAGLLTPAAKPLLVKLTLDPAFAGSTNPIG
jgi:hypothetical protein